MTDTTQSHCLFCKNGGAFCDKELPIPDWFYVGKVTPVIHVKRVALGLHPLGSPLSDDKESRCGKCRHLHVRKMGGTYFKCLVHKQTRGPATDIRKKWRGCNKYSE